MNNNDQQRIRIFIIVVIVAGIIGFIAAISGSIAVATAKIFAICLSFILFGITGTICMVVTRKPEYKGLGTTGMVISGLGFFLCLLLIIAQLTDEGLIKIALVVFIAVIALAHICFLYYINIQNKYAHYARIAATIAISLFSFFLIVQVFGSFQYLYMFSPGSQSTIRIIAGLFIAELATTLLVPLCNRLKVQETTELTFTSEKPSDVTEQKTL